MIVDSYYGTDDITRALALASGKDTIPESQYNEIDNAVFWIKCAAGNDKNADYWKVLYNTLLEITENQAGDIEITEV